MKNILNTLIAVFLLIPFLVILPFILIVVMIIDAKNGDGVEAVLTGGKRKI